jgi:hypothetical protein
MRKKSSDTSKPIKLGIAPWNLFCTDNHCGGHLWEDEVVPTTVRFDGLHVVDISEYQDSEATRTWYECQNGDTTDRFTLPWHKWSIGQVTAVMTLGDLARRGQLKPRLVAPD